MPKVRSIWDKGIRLIRIRLIVPLLRSPHPPEYKARGVAVGLAWAMTPLVGIQMWLVFMTWVASRKFFKWDFSLPLAIAWTWLTNVFTMIPIYYIFYVTGQIIRWQVDSISGYTTQVEDENTTYLVPKFKFIFPTDFDGRLNGVMRSYKEGFEQAMYDETDEAYLTFRFGAERNSVNDDRDASNIRIRHFYYENGDGYHMPLYNNSFYFRDLTLLYNIIWRH
jgi:hypothetical protein